MRNIIAVLSVIAVLLVFTFRIDGAIGVIIIAFMIFAPLVSFVFAVYARNRIKVSFDCDGFVKKNSNLPVKITVEKTGFFPLGIVEIKLHASEVFSGIDKVYRLSLISGDEKTFTVTAKALIGGNGEISVASVKSCGFLGFIGLKITKGLPQPISVGVIPEIPDIKPTSRLFRSIADSVMTSDDDESNDTQLVYSTNTAPGYEHREYIQGDPLKRVNWKLSMKKGSLMVRLDEAVSSVQPVVLLDLFRKQNDIPSEAVALEEKLICAVFGLAEMMIKQGIVVTFVYYGADGEIVAESVDNPDYPQQLLLKVIAAKVLPERRIRYDISAACAAVIASTDLTESINDIISGVSDKDTISLIGVSASQKNETDCKMWYLDGDNNFKIV